MTNDVLKRRLSPMLAGALLLSSLGLAAPNPAAADEPDLGGRLLLDVGHTDAFEVSLDDADDLMLSLKDDTFLHADQIVYRAPDDVVFQVRPESATQVPPGDQWAFLGNEGDAIYMLPQTQDHSLLWPGWSTERLRANQIDGQVQLSINDLRGPGELKLFQTSIGGISVIADTEAGLPVSWGVNVPAHVHSNWVFTEPGTYVLTVGADAPVAGVGNRSVEADYVFHVGDIADYEDPFATDPVETTLTIEGLAHHYHTGDAIELTAVQDPQTDLDHYHWYTRAEVDDEWTVVPDAGTDTLSLVAGEAPALDGTQVIARLFGDDHDVVAESDPVTIDIDDHDNGDHPVETTLTIEGVAHHYHTGDAIELTAVQDPQTEHDHYHWFTRTEVDDDWEVVPDAGDDSLSLVAGEAPALDGTQVIARLYDDDHDQIAESGPVTIVIDDHDNGDHPVETTLTIEGVAHHYHTGDTATLTAVQDPETDFDHYHWFVTPAGGSEEVVPGEGTDTYTFTVTADWDGAQVVAKLYDDDHEVIAESDPVTIVVDDHDDPDPQRPSCDVPGRQFPDVPAGSVHHGAVGCLGALEMIRGKVDGRFDPFGSTRRDQAASMIARLLEAYDVELPAGRSFRDVPSDSDHAGNIAALAGLEIIEGRPDATFDPLGTLTRAQTASILTRTLAVLDAPLASGPDAFDDDDGSPHEAAIDAGAAAGLIEGKGGRRFDPQSDVRRDQLASLLARTITHLDD